MDIDHRVDEETVDSLIQEIIGSGPKLPEHLIVGDVVEVAGAMEGAAELEEGTAEPVLDTAMHLPPDKDE